MTTEELIQEWVDQHDELTFDPDHGKIMHDNEVLGRLRGDNVSIGPDDGGVKGEPIEVDDGWLIVDGTQAAYAGQPEHAKEQAKEDPNATHLHGGMIEWQGKFAVQPWQPHQPEIDGPH